MSAATPRMPEDAVIYTTPKVLQVCLELDFLFHDIFPGARVCLDLNEALSARCLVYLEYDFEMHIAHAIKGAGKRLVLMHLGDETGIKDLSAYIVADAVLRNYYRPDIFSDERWAWKLRWMPNGYRNGLGYRGSRTPKPASGRRQWARFIGWLANPKAVGNERAHFEQAAAACAGLLHCVPTSGFAGGYSAALYQHLMEDAVYAPCPAGNAAETIRLFDALECGCIPISTSQAFLRTPLAMASSPIEMVHTWSHLEAALRAYRSRPEAAEILHSQQKQTLRYWETLKGNARSLAAFAVL